MGFECVRVECDNLLFDFDVVNFVIDGCYVVDIFVVDYWCGIVEFWIYVYCFEYVVEVEFGGDDVNFDLIVLWFVLFYFVNV